MLGWASDVTSEIRENLAMQTRGDAGAKQYVTSNACVRFIDVPPWVDCVLPPRLYDCH